MLALIIHNVDTLNGTVHSDSTIVGVDVRPLQAANLADAQSGG